MNCVRTYSIIRWGTKSKIVNIVGILIIKKRFDDVISALRVTECKHVCIWLVSLAFSILVRQSTNTRVREVVESINVPKKHKTE